MRVERGRVRAFLAIEIGEEPRARIHQLSERLRQSGIKASWVKPENLHLTLRFLGNYPSASFPALIEVLQQSYRRFETFDAVVHGVGLFPNQRKPRVIWTGVEGADAQLKEVHRITESALRAIGVPPDDKPFRPHLTIARIREGQRSPATSAPSATLATVLEREGAFDGGAICVSGVSLFESTLTPSGPVYNRLREFFFR